MTKIEWTEATWNPIVGCSIVSPGCTNCYAMRMASRIEAADDAAYRKRVELAASFYDEADKAERCRAAINNGRVPSHYAGTTQPSKAGPVWTGKVALAPERIVTEPLRRRKPTMYFVNSMSDLFHEDVPDEWIDRVFAVMALSPQHTFQVLTKRSARMRAWVTRATRAVSIMQSRINERDTSDPEALVTEFAHLAGSLAHPSVDWRAWPLPNVWLGVSAERQQEADARIPDLLATPAAVRFVSAEPLLGPIGFTRLDVQNYGYLNALTEGYFADGRQPRRRLDWIIVGGESGPGARPMHPDWARSIRDQCQAADVPFFFKQWGEWAPGTHVGADADRLRTAHYDGSGWEFGTETAAQAENGHVDDEPDLYRVGKRAAGRLLDGREWNETPAQRSTPIAEGDQAPTAPAGSPADVSSAST